MNGFRGDLGKVLGQLAIHLLEFDPAKLEEGDYDKIIRLVAVSDEPECRTVRIKVRAGPGSS